MIQLRDPNSETQAIEARDYPLLQGCILLIAVSYVVVNLLTDFVYALVDPRVRLE